MHIYAYIFLSSSCHQREIKGVVIRCDKLLISNSTKVAKFLMINFGRTNSLYGKPPVVFSPHTPCGRVRLARFTLEDHAYGASRLPKRTVLQSIIPFTFDDLDQAEGIVILSVKRTAERRTVPSFSL